MALTNAMGTALSGLSAQQFRLDVVGDNLANSSTPGFTTARVDFESLLAETLRIGSQPEGELGGVDPLQIGMGVGVAGGAGTRIEPGDLLEVGGEVGDERRNRRIIRDDGQAEEVPARLEVDRDRLLGSGLDLSEAVLGIVGKELRGRFKAQG